MQEILVYDENENLLDHLAQWDYGITIKIKKSDVEADTVDHINYFNAKTKYAYVVETESDGNYYTAIVPNAILREPYPVWGYITDQIMDGEEVKQERALYMFRITIKKQPQPSDKVYENTQDYIYLTDALQECIECAASAELSADRAEQAAAQSGYMNFYINGEGDLMYERTENVNVDFALVDGDLIVSANNLI